MEIFSYCYIRFIICSSNPGTSVGSRSSANHLSGDMIRRLRQQQQKSQDPKLKSITSTGTNVTSCPPSNHSSVRNSNSHPTYTTSSPLYGHTFTTAQGEDGRAVSYTRPPPLIEIESPLKGLSKLTSPSVVPPPNAIAPSSLKLNRDSRSLYGGAGGSSRYTPTKMSKDFRLESPPFNSTHSAASYQPFQGTI